MQAADASACIIIIGNEVLSGRTQDANIAWLAKALNDIGIRVAEARIVADDRQAIIDAVNSCRRTFTYVFTTGGIGPTHDDITSESIARAFGVGLARHPEAEAILTHHYGRDHLNPARLKMAELPEGAALILNPVSAAPGFQMDNVYVMAGVPSIMRAMFDHIRPHLKGGAKTLSRTVSAYITEGVIASRLTDIQNRFPGVEIGSYPFIRQLRLGTSLVARCTDAGALEACYRELKAMLLSFTEDVTDEDLAAA